ncbi:MAG: hypothetical protein JRH19_28840, partial [Deltaproteobacteria bacterium]|nr:hypothetical protein [Deltaproteobacteria bacterium]
MQSVAVFSSEKLGDALIDALLAQHLAESGLEVTLYSSAIADLDPLIAEVNCLPRPEDLESGPAASDLLLVDWDHRLMGELLDSALRAKLIVLNLSGQRPHLARHGRVVTPPEGIESRHPVLDRMLANWDRLEYLRDDDTHLIDGVVQLCRDDLAIAAPHRDLRFTDALATEPRQDGRVIICPTSAEPRRRSWSPQKYIRLAGELSDAGHEPHFAVAPGERSEWQNQLRGRFPLSAGSLLTVAPLLAA